MQDNPDALRAEIKAQLSRIFDAHLDRELANAGSEELAAFCDYVKVQADRMYIGQKSPATRDTAATLDQIIAKARAYKKSP